MMESRHGFPSRFSRSKSPPGSPPSQDFRNFRSLDLTSFDPIGSAGYMVKGKVSNTMKGRPSLIFSSISK